MYLTKFFLILLFFIIIFNFLLKIKFYNKKDNIFDFKNLVLNEKLTIKLLLYNKVIENNLKIDDYLILLKIAYAESCLSHYDKNGDVVKGKKNKDDVGVFQINKNYHSINEKDLNDYLNYVINLYKKSKTKYWIYSKKNWSKNIYDLRKMCNDI